MNISTNRTWAEVDLDTIAANMRIIRQMTSKNARLLAVVKADAYGHGAENTARVMLENGADFLAVACTDEAQQLRSCGINAPILILGHTPESDFDRIAALNVTAAIFGTADAKKLALAAKRLGKTAKVHIKLDTGMNRIGFPADDENTPRDIYEIYNTDGIEVEGIFTHFAKADENDDAYTLMQYKKFTDCVRKLERLGVEIPIKHVCNSAAIIKFKNMHLDMVRAGIISYGLRPSPDVEIKNFGLKPAMSIKSAVSRIQYIEKGQKISYGGTFTAPHNMKIATIPIGYADGYMRNLSNKARVIIGGEYAGVVGKICMDQCMIDVTDVNNISVGDTAAVMGRSDGKEVSCEFLADICGTINYEIVCAVSRRVPRVYLRNGKITDVVNYLV